MTSESDLVSSESDVTPDDCLNSRQSKSPVLFYRAVEDHECGADGRTRGECMARVLRKLRRSPGVQVAYLQKCVGIGDASAFKELIGLCGRF